MFCGAGAAAICFFALLGFGFSRAFFWTLLLAAFFAAVVFTARRFGTAWAARVFCALVFFNLLFLSGWLRDHGFAFFSFAPGGITDMNGKELQGLSFSLGGYSLKQGENGTYQQKKGVMDVVGSVTSLA